MARREVLRASPPFRVAVCLLFCTTAVPAEAQTLVRSAVETTTAIAQQESGATSSMQSAPEERRTPVPVTFPGYVSIASGYASPTEQTNLLTTMAVEQGVSVWRTRGLALVPYGALRLGVDQHGFDWNNKTIAQVGVKFVQSFPNGVAEIGAGYAHEERTKSDFAAGEPLAFANYWFGWGNPLLFGRPRDRGLTLPGSSWATVGNTSPAEKNNVIAMMFVEQGISAARLGHVDIVPFASFTLSVDSRGEPWNNLWMFGEGVKLVTYLPHLSIEAAAVYQQERRWKEEQGADRLGASLNIRYGWSGSFRR